MNLSEKLTSSTIVFYATMIDYDLPKERVIEVLNDMISLINKKPNYYFSRENIEYLKQIIIKNDR